MKIKLNWTYAKGELDTDTLKLICLPARGKRLFGADELDAELCIKDGMNYQIAEIHLGDVESSNILCEEITRRWNEFEDWHECKEDTEDVPPIGTYCILRVEYLCCSNKWKVDYLSKHSVNHVFLSPTSIINFTSKKQSYDDTRRSSRDNELLQRAQSDL